ncbi:ATP-dependent DNA helicase pif1-like [Battus philenor]|uniref:ATP-dependent DNA helicase pif1-like n=1 Tax=Battus philenor TaxID=42288 RepID=UPI0035D10D38
MRVALLNDLSADDFSKQLLSIGNSRVPVDESSRLIVATAYSFKSIDCVTNEEEATNYPIEFLNSVDVPGLLPHNLLLKVGSVVIMLRNLNQPKLCNGTRLVIRKLMSNMIHASILKGKFKEEEVLISSISMIPTDMPFVFKRIQFPIRHAFAMTINKSQDQSLTICGLNLENACFSHGQLYVACWLYLFLRLTKKQRMKGA